MPASMVAKAAVQPGGRKISRTGAPARALTLGVLRTLAGLVTAVLLALDLAWIARQHPALSQGRAQGLRSGHQRARDPMADGLRLRRDPAAAHAHDYVVVALGLGQFKGLEDFHARGVTRKIDLERTLVNADGPGAGKKPHPRDRGLSLADRPDFLLVCHLASFPLGASPVQIFICWGC